MSVTEEIKNIVRREVERQGYEFVDLNYGKKGKKWFMQVFCDKESGLTLNDCSKISREIGYELDRHEEILKHSYNLEVSSPGLTRPLKTERDFERNKGKRVKIKLFSPVDQERIWEGKILAAENGKVSIKVSPGEEKKFDISNISGGKLEVKI